MNIVNMLRALIPLWHRDPQVALASASALVSLLAANPSMLTAIIPANSTLPIAVLARQQPSAVIEFLQAELALAQKYEPVVAALVASAPDLPHA